MARRNGNLAVKLPRVVKAETVERVRTIRDTVAQLKKVIGNWTLQLEPLEASVIADLEAGAILEDGCPLVSVKEEQRRNVRWRQEFENRLGKTLAETIMASTEPTITKKLVIQ